MSPKSLVILLLIAVIVVDTVLRVVGDWELYANTGNWPLYLGFVVGLAALLETYCLLRFESWYYRWGPKIRGERWQTAGESGQIRQAVRPLLKVKDALARESPKGFMFRRPLPCLTGAFLRVFLRVEDAEQGAAIRYEVRPFYSVGLGMLFAISLFFSPYGGVSFIRIVAWYQIGVTVLWGVWAVPRELKTLARLRHIRRALAKYGLRVCTECGYDLFGQAENHLCPRCRAPLFVCFECGYDLHGQTEARCPECATPFEEHLLQQWAAQPIDAPPVTGSQPAEPIQSFAEP